MRTDQTAAAAARSEQRSLNVLIADRSPHFRETVRRVLGAIPGCRVSGQAATLTEVVRMVRRTSPEVVLLDVDLVIGQSPVRLQRLADAFPLVRVMVMLNDDSKQYRQAIAERWGYDCIAKDQAEVDLEAAIGQAIALP